MFNPGEKIIEIGTGKMFTFKSYQIDMDGKRTLLMSLKEDNKYYRYQYNYISLSEYRKQKLKKIKNVQ